ncbi:MAG: hypothetical protein RMJ87_13040 [Cytophagales bacterium]|nr:hypothetical protein [Bernardetiaceae bacterium]MDW8205947.1 hypothetical protein [Cytophagales bacterium]
MSENDSRNWYNSQKGYFTPISDSIMTGKGWAAHPAVGKCRLGRL